MNAAAIATRRKGKTWRDRRLKTIWLVQMGKCEHCGEEERFIYRGGGVSGSFAEGDLHTVVHRTSSLELDHIIPLHRGGSNESDNLQLLCTDCHKVKTYIEQPAREAVPA